MRCPVEGWVTSHSLGLSLPLILFSSLPPNRGLPLLSQGFILPPVPRAQRDRRFPGVCEKALGKREVEAPGNLGLGAASAVAKAKTGPGTSRGRIGELGTRRDGPAPWLPGPSLSAFRRASGLQVVGWGPGQVCAAAAGEEGVRLDRRPQGITPSPRSLSGWVSEVLRRSRREAASTSHALPPPHSIPRAPACAFPVYIQRTRPLLPRPPPRAGPASPRRRPPPPPLAWPPQPPPRRSHPAPPQGIQRGAEGDRSPR